MSQSRTFNGVAHSQSNTISDIRKDSNAALENLETNFRKITLTAAAEVADVITVTGAVTDAFGTAITAATQVLIRSLAVTADKGDLAAGATGTSKKAFNPATGENVLWMTTTSTGAFSFTVTNSAVEDTLVSVSTDKGYTANLKLTFA